VSGRGSLDVVSKGDNPLTGHETWNAVWLEWQNCCQEYKRPRETKAKIRLAGSGTIGAKGAKKPDKFDGRSTGRLDRFRKREREKEENLIARFGAKPYHHGDYAPGVPSERKHEEQGMSEAPDQ